MAIDIVTFFGFGIACFFIGMCVGYVQRGNDNR